MSVDTRVPGVTAEAGPLAVPPPPRRRPGRRRGGWLARFAPPLATFGIVLGIWYWVSLVMLDPQRRFLLLRAAVSAGPVENVLPRLGAVLGLGLAGGLAGALLLGKVVDRVRRTGTVNFA